MKRGIIVSDYPEKTGIGNYAIDVYNALKNDVHLDFLNLYNSKTFKEYPKLGNVLDVGNFYVGFFFGVSGRKLKKYLLVHDYDYVIFAHQGMGYLLPALSDTKIQKITVLHDLISYTVYKNNILHSIFCFFSVKYIICSDKIILTSKMTKNDFESLKFRFIGKTKIIHEYIDDSKYYQMSQQEYNSFQDLKNSHKALISSVTNGQKHKNDITFFRLAKEFPEFLFVKVGFVSQECLQYIKNNNLSNIKMLGKISLTNLRELYNITDVYVHTSLKEGFGYPPHEALFCGAKILAAPSIDMKSQEGIYMLERYDDIEEYKIGLQKLISQKLVFDMKDEYSIEKFRKNFIDFIDL